MPLRSAARTNLVDVVIEQVEDLISSGEWPLDSRIPSEPALVEQQGVGRDTVREAVRALVHTGMLEAGRATGPMCAPERGERGTWAHTAAPGSAGGVRGPRLADVSSPHLPLATSPARSWPSAEATPPPDPCPGRARDCRRSVVLRESRSCRGLILPAVGDPSQGGCRRHGRRARGSGTGTCLPKPTAFMGEFARARQ